MPEKRVLGHLDSFLRVLLRFVSMNERMKSVCFFLFLCAALPAHALLPPNVTEPKILIESKYEIKEEPNWIAHWNIRWFPGHHPVRQTKDTQKEQIRAVKRLLKKWNPDIFFACEVRNLESLKRLKLDYPYLACTDIPRTEDENPDLPQQGLAVMSRVPWKEVWVLDFSELPLTPDRPSRGILAAAFQISEQKTLVCYQVHLKSNRGGVEATRIRRERAIDYIKWDWDRKGLNPTTDPIIVLGDFNTSPLDPAFSEDETLSKLESLGFSNAAAGLPKETRITLPGGRFPPNDFDHIYLSSYLKGLRAGIETDRLVIHRVDREVSDHYPIFFKWAGFFD
ncbi:MAG: endonuclease/exonuclease/phosphatase family protein [Verrucomicrobiota bacterium]